MRGGFSRLSPLGGDAFFRNANEEHRGCFQQPNGWSSLLLQKAKKLRVMCDCKCRRGKVMSCVAHSQPGPAIFDAESAGMFLVRIIHEKHAPSLVP